MMKCNKRKSILIVSAVFPPEPITSSYLNYDLAIRLSEDYNVIVIRPFPTRSRGNNYTELDILNDKRFKSIVIASYTCPKPKFSGRLRESISFGWKCATYIKEHRDEIDFVYNGSWQLFGYYIVARTAKRYGIPYIVPIQDIYPETLFTSGRYPTIAKKLITAALRPIDIYYLKNASKIRTISNEMMLYISKTRNISESKFLVVNNWQNEEDFDDKRAMQPSKALKFAYVGSINAHANVQLIIKGFKKANIPDSVLKVFGGGDQKEECQQLVTELEMDNITFGFVSRNEIHQVQSQADVLVLALPAGNGCLCLPSKITSYMLSGRPILASVDLNSAIARYIFEGGCGKVVAPDNIEAMAEGFKHFADLDKFKLGEYGNNSRKFAQQNLSREVNLSKVVAAIKEIVK